MRIQNGTTTPFILESREDFLRFIGLARFDYCEGAEDREIKYVIENDRVWMSVEVELLVEFLAIVRNDLSKVISMKTKYHEMFETEISALFAENERYIKSQKKFMANSDVPEEREMS